MLDDQSGFTDAIVECRTCGQNVLLEMLEWSGKHFAERVYRILASHRGAASRVTTLLWGRTTAPSTYARSTWLFQRLLGVVYTIAFCSLGVQILGLVGRDGTAITLSFKIADHLGDYVWEKSAHVGEGGRRRWLDRIAEL